MGLKECNIILENTSGVYYPGQEVIGHVDYTFDSTKKIKGINIKFKGESEAHWSTHESRTIDNKTTHHTIYHYGEEVYFNNSFWLIGGQDNEIELNAGKYSYRFAFKLPITLPSSFEGQYGCIRYTIKVTLDRPWKFNQETKMAFTVVSRLNLNLMEEARASTNLNINKSFCCWWCKSGPLLVEVNLPVSGYCCGQSILFDINVENRSNVKINSISLVLKNVITYHSFRPRTDTKRISLQIVKLETEPVSAHSKIVWNKSMEIPPLPPTSMRNSRIIDIDYEIEVIANSSALHMNTNVNCPIFIGTIPLVRHQTPMLESHTSNTLSNQFDTTIYHLPSNSTNVTNSFQPPIYPPNPSGVTDPPPPYSHPSAPYPSPQLPYPPPQPFYPGPSAPLATDAINSKEINPNLDQQPVFCESKFGTKNICDSSDNKYTMVSGNAYFAPRYPTYGFRIPE